MEVFITDISEFMPNDPVDNDSIERVLGLVGGAPSRTKSVILKNNGIKARYYAIDPQTGKLTHTNAQLVAEAVKKLKPYDSFTPADIKLLCCGTASPDLLMPSHASMVHGELGVGPLETFTASGICMSGTSALKYACMSVALGFAKNAVSAGSELSSSFLRSAWCTVAKNHTQAELEEDPHLAFNADLLRWMLSDGAGAAFIAGEPNRQGLSLKVEWIESRSFAGELPACMFAGGVQREDGTIRPWRDFDCVEEAIGSFAHLVKQDVKLLKAEIVKTTVDRMLVPLVAEKALDLKSIDWFLPHYSSHFFRYPIMNRMFERGVGIDEEKWFTNLSYKGNTGSASIYIILAELFKSGKLKKGDRLLAYVPESGRFSMCYMLFTVV